MTEPAVVERALRAYPHLLVAALCLGVASAVVVRAPSGVLWVAIGLALLCVAVDRPELRLVGLVTALLLAGWWWGGLRVQALDSSVLAGQVGERKPAVVTVTGPVRRGMYRLRMPAETRRFDGRPLHEPVLLELPLGRAPPQGAVLKLEAQVRAPRTPEKAHGFDERTWLRRQGVHAVLRSYAWEQIGRRGGIGGVADRLRRFVARPLERGLDGERLAVVAGVVLGADEGLSDDLQDDFRASGLYHLLAVSGQNIAFIVFGVLMLAWLVGVPRWLGEIAALAAIGAYTLAVGLQPSVVRAAVAGALASLAWLVARPRDRWYFLLVGAAVLLGWNPYNMLEPGFQLSFAAVAAIFVAVPRCERLLEGYPIPPKLATVVAVSGACGVATAPILLLQFGNVPVYSVAANALAEPVVGPLLGLALVAAGLHPLLPDAAIAIAWLDGWLAAYLAGCARLVGGLPGARVSSLLVLGALAAGGALLWAFPRLRPPRAYRAAVLVVLAVLVVVGWRMRPQPAPPPPPNGLRVTFLDIGQGDAILLQVPQGAVLVDAGPPEGNAAAQLRRLGIRKLAAVVLTHPHRDHVGGVTDVVDRVRVGFLLDPRQPAPGWDEEEALRAAREERVPVVAARVGRVYRLGRLRLRVIWPDGPGLPGEDPHDHGVVLLASYGTIDALLTGDSESNVTLPLHPPTAEILKVAHHGSADEGLPALLRAVRPRIAVVSVGSHNSYGHPTPSTMAALHDVPGLEVLRTDRDGRVVVESDGERAWVRTEH